MNPTTVSVIMATFNHADYVAQAIKSVLAQQDVVFEFLIADDGSTDATREVIASIRDPRIKFFPSLVNRGACVVTNELINRASGEFIALINSDDYWIGNDKLNYQVQILQKRPSVGACFGQATFVDRNGCVIDNHELPHGRIFEQHNRSRGKWLRHLFDRGNCICHPTMLIRRSCYTDLGSYDNRLRQLPDMDMWVRLLKSYDIHISKRKMIAFRHLPGENASSGNATNYPRLLNESYFVLRKFFDGISKEDFLDGFGDLIIHPKDFNDIHMSIEQALLYLSQDRWASNIYNMIGLEKVYELLGDAISRSILAQDYAIDDLKFQALSTKLCAFQSSQLNADLTGVIGSQLRTEVIRRLSLRIPPKMRPLVKKFFR